MTEVHRLCAARNLSGLERGHRCRWRARWWVSGRDSNYDHLAKPFCGTHARGWGHRWPILTDDPVADRNALLETFA